MKRSIVLLLVAMGIGAWTWCEAGAQEGNRRTTYSGRAAHARQGAGPSWRSSVPSRLAANRTTLDSGVVVGDEVVVDEHVEETHLNAGEYVVDDAAVGEVEAYCNNCIAPRRFCICFPAHGWVHAEYLQWWQPGMNAPALVTTSTVGTARTAAGVLGQSATSVLLGGNDDILDGARSGGRIRFGTWFDACPGWGMEGEYFGFGTESDDFFRQSTGSPILARPFFNMLTGVQDSELVAFPNVLSGSIAVDADSRVDGAAARFRKNLCCWSGCGNSWLDQCMSVPTSTRIDGTVGYRFYELKESLAIRERLQSLDTGSPGSFDITDRFNTRNQFNGGELGVLWQGRRGFWSLDALMRIAIGANHQTVTITGNTTSVDNGTTSTSTSGIYSQRTNIGTFDRDQFIMIPEFGLTLGYQLTRRSRLTVGYSLIYWNNVIRPGDQIDTDINPNLFPPEQDPFTGPLRPQFQFVDSDYWLQGLNFGAEDRW